MIIRTLLVTTFVATMTAGAALATSITAQYEATSAVGSGSDHSLWFSQGIGSYGKDFDFDPAGLLTFLSDGTASLTGRVDAQSNSNAWFDVEYNYNDDFSTYTSGINFKSENGSTATGDTFFMNMVGGTLTGGGLLDGLELTVTRMPVSGPYATQIGSGTATKNGSNNKNNHFGMANWFFISVSSATCSFCGTGGMDVAYLEGTQGDVNIDLAPVPVPAGGVLLIGALGALGAVRRRKRKTA